MSQQLKVNLIYRRSFRFSWTNIEVFFLSTKQDTEKKLTNIYKIRLLGLVTLLLFPLPGFFLLDFFHETSWTEFFQVKNIDLISIGYGLEFGFAYAFIAYLFMKAPFFDALPDRVDRILTNLPLTYSDGIFLSVCAGIGEELLFRAGIQPLLGPWITSVVFVALHGYLNPWNWKFSMYGLIVLPFIVIISFGFVHFGLWFSIAAHFAYDAVLFVIMIKEKKSLLFDKS
jgi:membrane protease YdiL (CAAX protease family)